MADGEQRASDPEAQVTTEGLPPANEETALLGYSYPNDGRNADQFSSQRNGTIPNGSPSGVPIKLSVRRWIRGTMIFISIGLLVFLAAMNMPLTAVIQSSVTAEFDFYEGAAWLTASFMIATSLASPLAGRLCVIFQPLNFILFCAAVQFIGTVATALSRSFSGFIACRVIAGIGAGAMMPALLIIMLQMTDEKNRGAWIGLMNCGFTAGLSLGGVFAGRAIDSGLGWRTIFGIQAIIISVAGFLTFFAAPGPENEIAAERNEPYQRRLRRVWGQIRNIDFLGILCLSPALCFLLLGLSLSDIHPAIFAASAVFFFIFILVERRAGPDAIIPLDLLTSRVVFLSCISTLALMTARWVVLFYSPIWAMAVLLWTNTQAGTSLIPSSIGFGAGGICIGVLYMRKAKSYYGATLLCLGLFAATELGLALSRVGTPAWLLGTLTLANGLLTGAILNLSLAYALTGAGSDELPVITGLLTTFRNFAGPFGTTIAGGAFARSLQKSLRKNLERLDDPKRREELIRKLLGSPGLVRELKGEEQEVARNAYAKSLATTFAVATFVAVIATLLFAGTWKRNEEGKRRMEDEGADEMNGARE